VLPRLFGNLLAAAPLERPANTDFLQTVSEHRKQQASSHASYLNQPLNTSKRVPLALQAVLHEKNVQSCCGSCASDNHNTHEFDGCPAQLERPDEFSFSIRTVSSYDKDVLPYD
jgi:hypothetical protein